MHYDTTGSRKHKFCMPGQYYLLFNSVKRLEVYEIFMQPRKKTLVRIDLPKNSAGLNVYIRNSYLFWGLQTVTPKQG